MVKKIVLSLFLFYAPQIYYAQLIYNQVSNNNEASKNCSGAGSTCNIIQYNSAPVTEQIKPLVISKFTTAKPIRSKKKSITTVNKSKKTMAKSC